jgi:pimeloyl-ACP methyl ester carboxylesterase
MSSGTKYQPVRTPRSCRLAVRGIDYAVTEWGDEDAPLLFFLHGFADCGATFQFVVDAFDNEWHVIAPDWRGMGDTQVDTEAFWFPDYLADLDRLLEHYSPAEPVRLVGHSMGGNIAGLYAGAIPERVNALINIEGFGLRDSQPADAPARYRDWIMRGRDLPGPIRRDNFDLLASTIMSRNPRMSPQQAAFVASCWAAPAADECVQLKLHPAHKLPNAVLYRRAEAEACWREITARVMLVGGRDSGFGPVEELPFPRCEVAWIEESGHMLHFEQPMALARVIEKFLTKPST